MQLTFHLPVLKQIINEIVGNNPDIPTQLGIQRQTSRDRRLIAQQPSGGIRSSSPLSLGLVCALSTVVLEVHGRWSVG